LTPELRNTLVNGSLFNISWLAIVYTQSPVLGPLLALGHVLVHMRLMGQGSRELKLIGGVTLFGLALDQLLFAAGVFTVAGLPGAAPLWLSSLWPVLATTLCHAFSGLQNRLLLASLLGAIGGTMAYVAGTRMTDVEFGSPLAGPAIIGLLWAVLFPALARVARGLPTAPATSAA
jgi:hypothetical protein